MSHEQKKQGVLKELYRLWGMHMDPKNFRMSRRDLMKGMMSVGLTATAAGVIARSAPWGVKRAWAVEGDTPEERAIIAAKALFPNAAKKTISTATGRDVEKLWRRCVIGRAPESGDDRDPAKASRSRRRWRRLPGDPVTEPQSRP